MERKEERGRAMAHTPPHTYKEGNKRQRARESPEGQSAEG